MVASVKSAPMAFLHLICLCLAKRRVFFMKKIAEMTADCLHLILKRVTIHLKAFLQWQIEVHVI